jgi:D-glycero-D-manno-heptose 1,7-bisphosphate phosphatase
MGRPAIFLDRDGTLSHEIGYVNHASRFRLLPWAVEAVRLVNSSGRLAVLVTNQAGVARGYFPESVIDEVHAHVREAMESGGARLDAVYVCMHHPSVGKPPYRQDCDCRKPRPGLLRRAEAELGADLARSWMIGDRWRDVDCGKRAGVRTVFIDFGYDEELRSPPDFTAKSFVDAAGIILAHSGGKT